MKTQSEIMEGIAREAHKNQFRYDGKTPYVVHLERVVERVKNRTDKDSIIAAAWGHDLFEDTDLDAVFLKSNGIGFDVVYTIDILTKEKDQDYFSYIQEINNDYFVKLIKIADILDNLSDTPTKTQVAKYAKALNILLGYE